MIREYNLGKGARKGSWNNIRPSDEVHVPLWILQLVCEAKHVQIAQAEFTKAPSTRIRIFLNPQLFPSGYGYRPHAYGEFASKSGNFWIRSPEWKFLITFRIRVDGRIRIFSDTMSSQNWRQYLPRKFRHSRRSKGNIFCAPWAYLQSFSLYAAKCRSTKCWNKLCQKAAWNLRALPDKTAGRNNLNE